MKLVENFRFLLFVRAIQFYLGKNNSFSNSFKHVHLDVKKTNKQNITYAL